MTPGTLATTTAGVSLVFGCSYPADIINRSMFLTDLTADGGITYLEYTGKYGEPLWNSEFRRGGGREE